MESMDTNIENPNLTNINEEPSYIYEKSNKSYEIQHILNILGEKKTIRGKSRMGDLTINKTPDKRIELLLTSPSGAIKFEATDPHFNESLLKLIIGSFVPEIDENIN
ncbi:MAG: hypothetical protein V3575_03605 [Candidatus Absconditabacteria bacterium]